MSSYNRILPTSLSNTLFTFLFQVFISSALHLGAAMAVLTNQIWVVKVKMFTAPPNSLAAQCVQRPLECVSDLTLFIPLSVGTSQPKDELICCAETDHQLEPSRWFKRDHVLR
jgi:hypothetical protein